MQPNQNTDSESTGFKGGTAPDAAVTQITKGSPDPFSSLTVEDSRLVRLANLLQRNGVTELSPTGYDSMVRKIETRVSERRDVVILFSDVDGTFTPSLGSQTDKVMRQQSAAMREFTALVREQNYIFIPITGSSYEVPTDTLPSLRARVMQGEIPEIFDALIVEGGNKVVLKSPGESEFRYDQKYRDIVAKKINPFQKNLDASWAICVELMESVRAGELPGGDRVLGLRPGSASLRSAQDLIRQIEKREYTPEMRINFQQHAHPQEGIAPLDKLSLYFYATSLPDRDVIENAFVAAYPWLNVVCCEERDFNSAAEKLLGKQTQLKKYCMDITPVTKSTPIDVYSKFIGQITRYYNGTSADEGERGSKIMTVYFGDAGNDIAAASSQYVKKMCIVSGAGAELRRAADDLAMVKDDVFIDSDRSRPGVASMLAALRDWKLA